MTPKHDNFHVRQAQRQDAAFLPAVERSAGIAFKQLEDLAWVAVDDILSEEAHLAYIKQGYAWVAVGKLKGEEEKEEKGKEKEGERKNLLGFLCAKPLGASLHIAELSVRHESQGQGVGRALLEACKQYATQQGFQALTLTTFRHVPWNMPLYAHLGFTEVPIEELTPELKAIMAKEAQAGFLPSQRCTMQYRLN